MSDIFGDDIITITDEDGVEYVLEVLATLEVDGCQYYALVPASNEEEDEDLEVSILKSIDEDGEPILCAIEDDAELEAVYSLIMDQLYEEESE